MLFRKLLIYLLFYCFRGKLKHEMETKKNNLFQVSPKDIVDGIIEITQIFQSKYNSINIAIGGMLLRDTSCSINQVLIKEVNEILKAKSSKSFFIHISYDSCWTVANGSLSPDLFF